MAVQDENHDDNQEDETPVIYYTVQENSILNNSNKIIELENLNEDQATDDDL